MNDEQWNEQEIEKLLEQAPKIHDNRSKEDVFARLQAAGAFKEEEQPLKKPRKLPTIQIGGFVALLLCAIGLPIFYMMLNNNETADVASISSYNSDKVQEEIGIADESMESQSSESKAETNNAMTIRSISVQPASVIYEDDLVGNTLFSIGLSSDDTESIQASIIIPNDKILEDLGKANPSQVEMYNYYAPLLDEEGIQFNDYHPYKGQIIERGESVVHILPAGHRYDDASGTMEKYSSSLKNTFTNYKSIIFENEDGTAVEFSQVGEPSEPMPIETEQKSSYYLFNQRGTYYYVKQPYGQYEDAKSAIEAMSVSDNELYESAIIDGVHYTVTEDEYVHVTFTEPLDLVTFDPLLANQMIEAILLTAAQFDKLVLFENVVQTDWQGYDFTKLMPKPIAPNQVPISILLKH